nr:winged helix-turn-helix domain-containing protein [Mesorhizobium sp.]
MDAGPVVFRTVGEIAALHGVSKQAVSKVLKRLVEAGDVPVERDGRGRIVKVSLAHYEHARERFTNPAKAAPRPDADEADGRTIPAPSSGKVPQADSFEEARRQNEWLKVTRERLRHQEELRQLVRVDRLQDSLTIAGREIQAIIARLPNRADDLALAVSKEGQHGARTLLRTIAFELSEQIANRLAEIEAAAPAGDEMIEDPA